MRKLTKKQDALLRKAAATLRKSNDPNLQVVAKHLKGGLEVVNYIFEATDAARKKVPAQYEIEPVGIISTNKKTAGDLLAAQWLIGVVADDEHTDAGLARSLGVFLDRCFVQASQRLERSQTRLHDE